MYEHSLIVAVVKRGKASKVLHTLKSNDVSGGTIVYGDGTARNEFLKMFDLEHVNKEILFSVIHKDRENDLLACIEAKHHFSKPNSGIAFTLPLIEVITNKSRTDRVEIKENDKMQYEVIFVVVENHCGEEVVDIANKYGANGATIIHGRGSGIHEKGKIFNITIEPEKEIVMMLVDKNKHSEIIDGLSEELSIDEPGNGIIFSAGVNQALGLVK